MKLFYFFLFCLIFFAACKKNDSVSPPVACFSVDMTESTDSTHAFLFDQCPPAYDVSYWDFGDGQYSSNPNPSHQFNHYGTYNVKLTVTNSAAQTNSVTHTITIGHYSLSKIIYLQTSSSTQMPKQVTLDFYSFIITDSILSQSQLPYTHNLPDSSLYDIHNYPYIFWYKEIDTLGDTSVDFQCRGIYYPLVNYQEEVHSVNLNDTVKLSLVYRLVPH